MDLILKRFSLIFLIFLLNSCTFMIGNIKIKAGEDLVLEGIGSREEMAFALIYSNYEKNADVSNLVKINAIADNGYLIEDTSNSGTQTYKPKVGNIQRNFIRFKTDESSKGKFKKLILVICENENATIDQNPKVGELESIFSSCILTPLSGNIDIG